MNGIVNNNKKIAISTEVKREMNGREYQELAMRTNDGNANYRLRQAQVDNIEYDFDDIFNACLGLSGEVGEFNDMIKKWIFHEKDFALCADAFFASNDPCGRCVDKDAWIVRKLRPFVPFFAKNNNGIRIFPIDISG